MTMWLALGIVALLLLLLFMKVIEWWFTFDTISMRLKTIDERLILIHKQDEKLLEILTDGDLDRIIRVPLKTVVHAVKRLEARKKEYYDGQDLEDTAAEERRQEKEIQRLKDLEYRTEHGFVHTMIAEENKENIQ